METGGLISCAALPISLDTPVSGGHTLKGQCQTACPAHLSCFSQKLASSLGDSSMGSVPRRKSAQCCRNIYITDLQPQRAVSIEGRADCAEFTDSSAMGPEVLLLGCGTTIFQPCRPWIRYKVGLSLLGLGRSAVVQYHLSTCHPVCPWEFVSLPLCLCPAMSMVAYQTS